MSKETSGEASAGARRTGIDEASNMARLIMDDWKRFFRTNGVPLTGVCRVAKRVIDLGTQHANPPPERPQTQQVVALTSRVAELEAELARLRAQTPRSPSDQS